MGEDLPRLAARHQGAARAAARDPARTWRPCSPIATAASSRPAPRVEPRAAGVHVGRPERHRHRLLGPYRIRRACELPVGPRRRDRAGAHRRMALGQRKLGQAGPVPDGADGPSPARSAPAETGGFACPATTPGSRPPRRSPGAARPKPCCGPYSRVTQTENETRVPMDGPMADPSRGVPGTVVSDGPPDETTTIGTRPGWADRVPGRPAGGLDPRIARMNTDGERRRSDRGRPRGSGPETAGHRTRPGPGRRRSTGEVSRFPVGVTPAMRRRVGRRRPIGRGGAPLARPSDSADNRDVLILRFSPGFPLSSRWGDVS